MKLIVGLGNPGKKYEHTPHNAGYLAVDSLCKKIDIDTKKFKEKKSLKSLVLELNVENEKIILAKPTTFMNESGIPVKALMKYYKLNIKDIIVLHDDTDIVSGKVKVATSSRAAGHNGVQSIINTLGTKDFTRIRIGVQLPIEKELPLEKFVLQKLNKKTLAFIQEGIDLAVTKLFEIL